MHQEIAIRAIEIISKVATTHFSNVVVDGTDIS
jgi:hypothetical protein